MKDKIKSILGILLVVLLFILASYLTQVYQSQLKTSLEFGIWGMVIYIIIGIIATVIAPISTLPLLPIATTLWGWVIAAILSIVGWTIGSVIAFYLARKYGVKLVSKITNINTLQKYENLVPTKHIFFSIIALRIVLPVDILSYLLGLFSKVPLSIYTLATIIGITPFAFILSYLGGLSITLQLVFLSIGIPIIILNFLYLRKKFLLNNN